MAHPIDAFMIQEGAAVLYDPAFRSVVEDHLLYLRNHPGNGYLTLDPHDVFKYEFDFFGLLLKCKIRADFHWIIMRINGISSPNHTNLELTGLIIPQENVMSAIRLMYVTSLELR